MHGFFFIISLQFGYLGLFAHSINNIAGLVIANLDSGFFWAIFKA